MTDPILGASIASATTTLLANWWSKGSEEFFKASGKAAWEKAAQMVALVREKFRHTPQTDRAFTLLQSTPNESQVQSEVQAHLQSLMQSDPAFATQLVQALHALKATEQTHAGATFNNTFHRSVGKVVQVGEVQGDLKL